MPNMHSALGPALLETVASFRDPWEAHLLRLRLEAEGIPASVAFQYHVGNNWWYSTALGGAKVQVPRSWLREARAVELSSRTGVFEDELRTEFGEIDDVRCPRCGSERFQKRRPIASIVLALVFAADCPDSCDWPGVPLPCVRDKMGFALT